jgi:hypothetical protein
LLLHAELMPLYRPYRALDGSVGTEAEANGPKRQGSSTQDPVLPVEKKEFDWIAHPDAMHTVAGDQR